MGGFNMTTMTLPVLEQVKVLSDRYQRESGQLELRQQPKANELQQAQAIEVWKQVQASCALSRIRRNNSRSRSRPRLPPASRPSSKTTTFNSLSRWLVAAGVGRLEDCHHRGEQPIPPTENSHGGGL